MSVNEPYYQQRPAYSQQQPVQPQYTQQPTQQYGQTQYTQQPAQPINRAAAPVDDDGFDDDTIERPADKSVPKFARLLHRLGRKNNDE